MAQGNFCWVRGDITGDIYFDHLRPANKEPIPYVRLYLMINGSREMKPVHGLRILCYGALAEIVYAHVHKGSRIAVEGHIQMRQRPDHPTPVFEIVAERAEFLRNIDFVQGQRAIEEIKKRLKAGSYSEDLETVKQFLEGEGIAYDLQSES